MSGINYIPGVNTPRETKGTEAQIAQLFGLGNTYNGRPFY